MSRELTFESAADALIKVGRDFYKKDWVPATAGNFSVRLNGQRVAITVSGRHKGELNKDDIMIVDVSGRAITEGKKSSAETLLHTSLYQRDENIGAVLHTHSRSATLLSMLCNEEIITLRDYEVLKAFPGIDTHEAVARVPVFANDQDIVRLSAAVQQFMDENPPIFGYLIEGHGYYTWGADIEEARRHIEAFEFLFGCELELRKLRQ